MKYLITRAQHKRVIMEDKNVPMRIGSIIKKLNNNVPNIRFFNPEDYGLDRETYLGFMRRIDLFKECLAQVINAGYTNEYDLSRIKNVDMFIELFLGYSLMDFFYVAYKKEYDLEDFLEDGQHEGLLYLTKELYGDVLRWYHEEFKR